MQQPALVTVERWLKAVDQCFDLASRRLVYVVERQRSAPAERGVPPDILRVDPSVRDRQLERIRAVKARRDEARAVAALAELDRAAALHHIGTSDDCFAQSNYRIGSPMR